MKLKGRQLFRYTAKKKIQYSCIAIRFRVANCGVKIVIRLEVKPVVSCHRTDRLPGWQIPLESSTLIIFLHE